MPSNYNPEKRSVGNLLSMTNPPLLVPDWQRNYSWTVKEAESYWQDLIDFSERYPDDNINEEEYFLGSVVLVDNQNSHLVLDGQQRLATSAILLSVIRDFLHPYKADAATRTSQRYLTDYDDALEQNTYKLTLNRFDRDFFRREILEPRTGDYAPMEPELNSHRSIRSVREFFQRKFSDKYEELDDPQVSYQWTLRVQKVLTSHVSTVAVISGDEDNAASVFETLNDRGIGLSTPDLLRNLLLRRTNEENLEEAIDLWGEILEVESEGNLNNYIRHFWVSRHGDVKTKALYREIKAQIIENDIDSLVLTRDLSDASAIYTDILTARHDNYEIASVLEKINQLGANLLYPPALSLLATEDDEAILKGLKAYLTAYVRHAVIGRLENAVLETESYTTAKDIFGGAPVNEIIERLKAFSPDDDSFRHSFARASLPRSASARYILTELELDLRTTEELDVAPPSRVHVEHIYPRTPQNGHRLANHSAVLNRIGNLTLLSRRLNTVIKNAPFEEKKPHYEASELLLTQALTDKDEWTPAIIDERQQALSERAAGIWNFPDDE